MFSYIEVIVHNIVVWKWNACSKHV